jgi:riboflavin biosynthesis pyrimidine reductase
MGARCTRRWRFGRRQRSFLAGRRPCWTSREFGKAAGKILYSKSREIVSTPKTRLEREFHPQVARELKAQSPLDISVAGPTLAAHAIRTGLVDEYHLLVVPAMLGGGKRVLPGNVCVRLDLLDERRFTNGMVYLRYRTQAVAPGSER